MVDVTMSVVGDPARTSRPDPAIVLSVTDLRVEVFSRSGPAAVVDEMSFDLREGETFGLVGESGSGKSMTSLALLGLIDPRVGRITKGSIRLGDRELVGMPAKQLRAIRGGEIGMIFQEPRRSLDPAFTVGDQIASTVRRHTGKSRKAAWEFAVEMLDRVHIADPRRRAAEYPHQMSGGMAQRAMLAIALSCAPKVLIADEPTTALDVTVQAQVLDLIREMQDELGLAVIFVSHDLGVIAEMSDQVGVMYAGQLVERTDAVALFRSPRHPYTAALLAASSYGEGAGGRLSPIRGVVPPMSEWSDCCRFHWRCDYRTDRCGEESPMLAVSVADPATIVRCHHADELRL